MNFIKKHKDYFYLTGISLLICLVIFFIKGIYPFGNNSLIYGDMYVQITSFYYYFHDSIFSPNSLFINFGSANGLNFFSIFSYYILSPFTLLTLLFKRSQIYLMVSVIIILKIILSNITALYMLKKLFKNLNSIIAVMLALLYGFSLYSLSYYQITAWIDVMYMLPLIIVGLKELFTNNNPKIYIITLFLAICMNFYIALMLLIFIFLISIFYLINYHKKELGKNILALGLSTFSSIGLSSIIILPTLNEYLNSSRVINGLETLLNSKLGPITDKITLFLFGPILFVSIIALLKDYKKHQQFLKFYLPSLLLLLIPIICEPINKLLHFGSYYFFTYRFGFITIIFLIIGAAYYWQNRKIDLNTISKKEKIIIIALILFSMALSIFMAIIKFDDFQKYIELLSLSSNKILIIILLALFLILFVINVIIIMINKNLSKFQLYSILIINIIHITFNSYLFLGNNYYQESNNEAYKTMNLIYNDHEDYGIFKYKDESNALIKNSSNVTGIPNMDSFSSLTNASSQDILKSLGYTSFQSRTHSLGGTLFSDILLGNKYILSKNEELENYSLLKKYNDLFMHQYNKDISYGYLVNNDVNTNDYSSTFMLQNAIYSSITNDSNLFDIVPITNTSNLTIDGNSYNITSKDNYISYDIDVTDKKQVYLEILKDINFSENRDIFKNFDIYVNNSLIKDDYPTLNDNGVINIGVFDTETINIKIVFKNNCTLKSLNVGLLDLTKLDNFVNDNKLDYDIKFNNNKINININSNKENTLFLPINYSKDYKVTNNNEKSEMIKLYDNFIGIKLNAGENNITISYLPHNFYLATIISIISLIINIVFFVPSLFKKIINIKLLKSIAKFIYLGLYIIVLLLIYIIPIICFFLSFIKYINI